MANPGTMTAVIKSGDIRDQFRINVNDAVVPFKFSDTLLLAWMNDAIRTLASENSVVINDTAIVTAFPEPIASIVTSVDICLKPGCSRALVSYCAMKAFEYLREADKVKAYYDRWHAEFAEALR